MLLVPGKDTGIFDLLYIILLSWTSPFEGVALGAIIWLIAYGLSRALKRKKILLAGHAVFVLLALLNLVMIVWKKG